MYSEIINLKLISLEGVKGDAHGEKDIQVEGVGPSRGESEQGGCSVREKVVILEEKEERENHRGGPDERRFASRRVLLHDQAGEIGNKGGGEDEQHEHGIPPHIKDVTGRQQEIVFGRLRHGKKERGHHRKKQQERNGIEQHGDSLFSLICYVAL